MSVSSHSGKKRMKTHAHEIHTSLHTGFFTVSGGLYPSHKLAMKMRDGNHGEIYGKACLLPFNEVCICSCKEHLHSCTAHLCVYKTGFDLDVVAYKYRYVVTYII
jgi:hypothetical protein